MKKQLLISIMILALSCEHKNGVKPLVSTPDNGGTLIVVDQSRIDEVKGPGFEQQVPVDGYYTYTADPSEIRMYWKHEGEIIRSFTRLKQIDSNVVFAMNGGMFTPEYGPVGLYIEKGKQLKSMKRYNNPKVNFGLHPQGVFLIRSDKAEVVPIDNYNPKDVIYATQSAPMVVIDSKINPRLPKSDSRTIRNGVILPDGKALLACSAGVVTFQEFAAYFQSKGCISALYLDGGISRITNGGGLGRFGSSFGVMIGVVKNR